MGQGRSLGFGFLVGAKDDGATETTEKVSEGFGGIARNVAATVRESAGLQRFGNMINALSLTRLNQISESLEGLADRAGSLSGEISSTSMESFGAEFSQTYRQATAGLGVFRGAVDEVRGDISSLSFTLGVDAAEMTAYATTVARTGRQVEDFGLDMRAVAGSIQSGILSGEDLGTMLTGLAEGYDLGTEGASRLLDRVTALGERFGSGADAARAMPEVLSAIDEVASRFPEIGANVDTATESIIRLALAEQQGLGVSFQEGVQNAVNVFSQLGETRGEMEGLVSGLNTEFPDLASKIAQIGGIDMSMDAIMQDPVRFAASMASMYGEMEPTSAQAIRLRDVLEGMGPSFAFLIQGGEDSQRALAAAMESIDNTEGAFNRMARAASGSTHTFAESMERLEDGFRNRVDRMAQKHYPNFERNVINRQMDAYNRLEARINSLVENNGPFGKMAKLFLAFRRGGIQGLIYALQTELAESFPRLSGAIGRWLPLVADAIEGLVDFAAAAIPAAAALKLLGVNMSALTGPLRLATNPLVLFGLGIYALVRYWDQLEPLIEQGVTHLEGFADKFKTWVDSIDWDKAGQSLVAGILEAFGSAGEAVEGQAADGSLANRIGNALGTIFRAAGKAAKGAIDGMWSELVQYITEPEDLEGQLQRGAGVLGTGIAATMVSPMAGPLMSAATGIVGVVGRAGGMVSGAMGQMRGLWGRLGTAVAARGGAGAIGRGIMGTAGRAGLRAIPGIGAVLGILFDLPDIISSFKTEGIVGGLRELFGSIVNGLLLGIPSLIDSLTGTTFMSDILDRIFDVSAWGLGDIFGTIGEAFTSLHNSAMTHVLPIFNSIKSALGEMGEAAMGVWNDTLGPMVNEIGSLLNNMVSGLLDMLVGEGSNIEGVFVGISSVVSILGTVFGAIINTVGPFLRWMGEMILPVIVFSFNRLVDVIRIVGTVIRVIVAGFQLLWNVIEPILGLVVDIAYAIAEIPRLFTDFNGVVEDLKNYFLDLGIEIGDFWHQRVAPAFEFIGEVWSQIGGAIWSFAQSVFQRIGDFVGTIVGGIVAYFQWVFSVWQTVGMAIWNAGRQVFDWLAQAGNTAIDLIVGYFRWVLSVWQSVGNTIWNAGRQVFDWLSQAASTAIDYIVSYFRWVLSVWQAIGTAIWDAGRQVFDWLAQAGSSAFDYIADTIMNVQERWRIAREMLGTGFEYIGSKIRQYFLGPVMRVRNNFSNMIDRLREGFLSVKVAVLQMYQAIFSRIARISILPDSVQDAFRRSSEGLGGMIATSQAELRTLRSDRAQEEVEIRRQEAAAQQQAEEARARMAALGNEMAAVGTARRRVPATEDRPAPSQPRERVARNEAARAVAQAESSRPQPVVLTAVERQAAGALSPTVNVQAPGPGRPGSRRPGPRAGEDRADDR